MLRSEIPKNESAKTPITIQNMSFNIADSIGGNDRKGQGAYTLQAINGPDLPLPGGR